MHVSISDGMQSENGNRTFSQQSALPVTLARHLYSNWQFVASAKRVVIPRIPHLVVPCELTGSRTTEAWQEATGKIQAFAKNCETIKVESHTEPLKDVETDSEAEGDKE